MVNPGACPVILEIALIETGDIADNMVRSWDIGDGRSVALLMVKEKGRGSGSLRLLA